jgi:hypothetical protein
LLLLLRSPHHRLQVSAHCSHQATSTPQLFLPPPLLPLLLLLARQANNLIDCCCIMQRV